MNIAEYDYQMWRKALHDLQIKIDNFDKNFWCSLTESDLDDEAFPEVQKNYEIDRQKLVDELEAHYKSEPIH